MNALKKFNVWAEEQPDKISLLAFALFASWMLSIPFEGKTLYALAVKNGITETANQMSLSGFFHLLGLATSWVYVRNLKRAKQVVIFSVILSFLGNFAFITEIALLWMWIQWILSYIAGVVLASWGFWFREYPRGERFKVAANLLILANLLMIAADFLTATISPTAGLVFSWLCLSASLFCMVHLPVSSENRQSKDSLPATTQVKPASRNRLLKSIIVLFLFIAVITVNSGIMYAKIMPSYSHHPILVSWYWAIPYIATIFVMRRVLKRENRFVFLMMSIAMIGVSFLLYSFLDNSAISFLLVNTIMMSSYGFNDLFWWGTLGEMLDEVRNPIRLYGMGLSSNLLGIILGKNLIVLLQHMQNTAQMTINFSFIVVLLSIAILPLLYKYLTVSLNEVLEQSEDGHLDNLFDLKHQEPVEGNLLKSLTEREIEIVNKLMSGRTYKAISEELYISENTIKYHIKNIYSKLGVHNKTELLHLIREHIEPES